MRSRLVVPANHGGILYQPRNCCCGSAFWLNTVPACSAGSTAVTSSDTPPCMVSALLGKVEIEIVPIEIKSEIKPVAIEREIVPLSIEIQDLAFLLAVSFVRVNISRDSRAQITTYRSGCKIGTRLLPDANYTFIAGLLRLLLDCYDDLVLVNSISR